MVNGQMICECHRKSGEHTYMKAQRGFDLYKKIRGIAGRFEKNEIRDYTEMTMDSVSRWGILETLNMVFIKYDPQYFSTPLIYFVSGRQVTILLLTIRYFYISLQSCFIISPLGFLIMFLCHIHNWKNYHFTNFNF